MRSLEPMETKDPKKLKGLKRFLIGRGVLPWLVMVFISWVLGACITPVIPIPPPPFESLHMALSSPGNDSITITGDPNPSASGMLIFIYNLRNGEGIITTAEGDGSFTTEPFPVQNKDRLDLWVAQTAEDPSDSLCVEVDLTSSKFLACPGS